MNRHALTVVALCAGLIAGCAEDDTDINLTQVERRVAKLVGDTERGAAEAKCVELTPNRSFRCEVSVNSIASTYDARVSEKGEHVELEKR